VSEPDGYTGHVDNGGPPATRTAGPLQITKVSVGPMDNNAYLLRSTTTGEQLLVDAANDADTLVELVGDAGLARIVTTHRHQDHWQGLAAVVSATGARTAAGVADAEAIGVPTDELLAEGDEVTVGDVRLEVIQLVGHTPGSVALLYRDPTGHPHLFTGDSLFPGGVGKTTPETFPRLIDDVEEKLFAVLPDDTWVYPGHGDDTTLGAERPALPEWRARGW
jgi:glyoxylase-like metal-dependent hydrolase (beta-lactamase superfamily II)